ncbi:MAG: potassium transporter TrkG [Bacilli bacterium]|nr:potassium transporter TrkG [Bacillales bacterium]MDY2574535.1 potassium transporter TrkG [Bacilli bacterium]
MVKKRKITPVRLISLGYLITILIGTLLLFLPITSKSGKFTNIIDALFTSTSATCVTGLVPFDTFSHWNIFGQIVILILIQIGGIGFMTIITLFFMMFKKNIGIFNRTVLMQSAGSYNISEVGALIKRIIKCTILCEGIGTIILTFCFMKDMNFAKALYYGIFHSVSAFCNAGFDIFGAAGGSLTDYYSSPLVLITIMILIVIGGLGFIVWSDIIDSKFKISKLQLHTKIVLVFNSLLIIFPAILFFVFEFTGVGQKGSFQEFSLADKIFNSLFLSISPRTAGFNSVNLNELTSSGKLLTIILMFIGGNSGSTAGGVKVTTFIVVMANLISSAKGKKDVVMFKRKISTQIIKQSSSLIIAYLVLILVATLTISAVESCSLEEVLFETVSALGTVGLSLGLSATGSVFTKIILIFLMYSGRLGALTLFSLFIVDRNDKIIDEPKGKILVG